MNKLCSRIRVDRRLHGKQTQISANSMTDRDTMRLFPGGVVLRRNLS